MFQRIREIAQYRSMLWGMTSADLRTRYKGSALGFLWTFVNPLLTLVVYTIIFSVIMRANIKHYAVFMFTGLLAWNMFATSVQSASNVIVGRAALVKKIYFPREILPLSIVLGSLINYLLSLLIYIPFLLIYGFKPSWLWLYLPFIVLVVFMTTLGLSLVFSSLNVFFRDLEHMLGIFIQLWFYVTPVIYSINMVPARFRDLFKINPLTSVILSLQNIFYYGQPPHWKLLMYGGFFGLVSLLFGTILFGKLSKKFAEEV